jgi:hypothetical protein
MLFIQFIVVKISIFNLFEIIKLKDKNILLRQKNKDFYNIIKPGSIQIGKPANSFIFVIMFKNKNFLS